MKYKLFHNQDFPFMRGYQPGDRLVAGWEGEVPPMTVDNPDAQCEAVFMIHNRDNRPDGQTAPSLSVGDVVVLVSEAGEAAYTVMSVGFERVFGFAA